MADYGLTGTSWSPTTWVSRTATHLPGPGLAPAYPTTGPAQSYAPRLGPVSQEQESIKTESDPINGTAAAGVGCVFRAAVVRWRIWEGARRVHHLLRRSGGSAARWDKPGIGGALCSLKVPRILDTARRGSFVSLERRHIEGKYLGDVGFMDEGESCDNGTSGSEAEKNF